MTGSVIAALSEATAIYGLVACIMIIFLVK